MRPEHGNLTLVIRNEHERRWPTVHITADAHGKMRALIDACPIEISWLSTCSQLENGDVVIDDVFVPKQRCTMGSTFINEDGEAELLAELLAKKRHDLVKKLHCWGHSHVAGMVFASGTDEQQTEDFLRRARETRTDFFVRLIANKYDDLFASIYFLNGGYDIHHAPIIAEPPNMEPFKRWARREVKNKVNEIILPKPKVKHSKEYLQGVLDEFDRPTWYYNFLGLEYPGNTGESSSPTPVAPAMKKE